MKYENRFKGIFYGIADIVSLIGNDYTILMVNRAYEKLLSRPADECIGNKCYDLIRGRETPCEDCPLLDIRREGEELGKLNIIIGHEHVSLTRHPIYNDRGELTGVFEIGRIMTREFKMHQELQHQGRLKIMGEITSSIIHEIKNPLAGIGLMTASIMERLPQKDFVYHDLESILHEIQRLEELLENLMNFAKPRSFQRKKASIHTPIDMTLRLLNKKIKPGGIRIRKVFNRQIPKVLIDPSKMQQVFFNIFLNSIAAMPDGGELIIKTDLLEEEIPNRDQRSEKPQIFRQVHISIQDTGTGIKEEDIPYVFDPFFSKSSRGTGLGLSVVSRIIQLHNGSINIQSQKGKGTTVNIYIPWR